MFIKKPKAVRAYAYRMLLSFKTLIIYKKKINSRRTTVSLVKQTSSDITRFFAKISVLIFRLDLYVKPTDIHQYLHSSSCHP